MIHLELYRYTILNEESNHIPMGNCQVLNPVLKIVMVINVLLNHQTIYQLPK